MFLIYSSNNAACLMEDTQWPLEARKCATCGTGELGPALSFTPTTGLKPVSGVPARCTELSTEHASRDQRAGHLRQPGASRRD